MGGDERRRERVRLSAAIRDRREAAGLSRRDVADRSGLSYPYVSQLENGDREPSLEALGKLAAALDVPMEDLLRLQVRAHTAESGTPAAPAAPGTPGTPSPTDLTWHANPAFSASLAGTHSRRRRVDIDLAVEDAYTALLALVPSERLDAAGVLMARCLRDAAAGPGPPEGGPRGGGVRGPGGGTGVRDGIREEEVGR